jgi:hypothetical protein
MMVIGISWAVTLWAPMSLVSRYLQLAGYIFS